MLCRKCTFPFFVCGVHIIKGDKHKPITPHAMCQIHAKSYLNSPNFPILSFCNSFISLPLITT